MGHRRFSANKYTFYGSGVCETIYKRANKELLEENCKSNYQKYESEEPLKNLLESYNNIFGKGKGKAIKILLVLV